MKIQRTPGHEITVDNPLFKYLNGLIGRNIKISKIHAHDLGVNRFATVKNWRIDRSSNDIEFFVLETNNGDIYFEWYKKTWPFKLV